MHAFEDAHAWKRRGGASVESREGWKERQHEGTKLKQVDDVKE